MQRSDKVLTCENLMEIANFMLSHGYDSNITIEIEVEDKEMIKKINDDFYYRYGVKNSENSEKVNDIDTVNICIGGIKFKYLVKSN